MGANGGGARPESSLRGSTAKDDVGPAISSVERRACLFARTKEARAIGKAHGLRAFSRANKAQLGSRDPTQARASRSSYSRQPVGLSPPTRELDFGRGGAVVTGGAPTASSSGSATRGTAATGAGTARALGLRAPSAASRARGVLRIRPKATTNRLSSSASRGGAVDSPVGRSRACGASCGCGKAATSSCGSAS